MAGASAIAAVLLLAGGCSGDDATPSTPETLSPTPSPTPAPPAPPTADEAAAPESGGCHRLSFDEALAPTSGTGAVKCTKAHTAETYAVGRVVNLVDGHLLAIDSDRVQDQVATTCPDALSEAVGGSRDDVRLSMLRAVWFTPTVEESDAGADWYRCDVVALAGAESLTQVRGSLGKVLATPEGRATYGMCGTAGPDDKAFERVPCGEQHSWRAFSVIELPEGDYPGRDAVSTAGAPCQDAAAAIAEDALDYEWGFEGPDRAQWDAGQTFVRCWAPD